MTSQRKIYFDYASTTPVDPEVVEAMLPFFHEKFGNASSPHGFGREAGKALEDARQATAGFLGAKADEIVFTSGATEANNQAIYGIARAKKSRGMHLIASAVEHHSVLRPLRQLEREGWNVTRLPVDAQGTVGLEDLKRAVTDGTVLVAVMHAGNEIGTIQPVAEMGRFCRERGISFLVDAVQTAGHLPVNVQALGADVLSLSAHKFYGPKGAGALYIRKGTQLAPYLLGGDQEKGRRASTQNVAGAVGLAAALARCQTLMAPEAEQQSRRRNTIIAETLKNIPGTKLNGHPTERLANNAHFSFEKVSGEALLMSLDMEGMAASMGSACTSGALEPSHVLRAIGLSDELAYGSLRITLGRWTTQDDVDHLCRELPGIVQRLRI